MFPLVFCVVSCCVILSSDCDFKQSSDSDDNYKRHGGSKKKQKKVALPGNTPNAVLTISALIDDVIVFSLCI